MKKLIIYLILTLLIITSLIAQDVKIGLYAGAYPVSFIDNEGNPAGLYHDILIHILKYEGYKPTFIAYDIFSDMYEDGKNGKLDIVCNLIKTPEREKDFYFSEVSINSAWSQIFIVKSSNIKTIEDLIGKRVGLMNGDQNGKYFIDMMEKFNFNFLPVYYNSFDKAIKAMQFGYIEAMASYNLLSAKYEDIVGTSIIFNPSGISLATTTKSSPEILKLFSVIDNHLSNEKNNSDSPYYNILNKWLQIEVIETETIPVIIYWIISIIFIIILVTSGIIILMRLIIKNKTNEIKDSVNRYKMLHEASFGGIVIHDNGLILECNHGLSVMTGLSYDELIGMNGLLLISDDTRDIVIENIKNKIETKYEVEGVRRDGSIYPMEIESRNIKYKKNEVRATEFRDITELKEKENRNKQLESELGQARKMDAINKFSGSIAHDFNNIITVINGFTELSLLNLDNVENNLLEIKESCLRAEKLTSQLLLFSSKSVINTEIINLNDFLNKFKNMIVGLIDEDIILNINLNHTGKIKADLSQLDQVLLNIVSNSRDAINAKDHSDKEIKISTSNVKINGDIRSHKVGLKAGQYIVIRINDNGIGMSKEVSEKIYEPFFTTKDVGKGTGLGMATVYSILKQNNGGVYVYSEEGEGTEFKLYWPVSSGEIMVKEKKDTSSNLIGKETLLCVEDEPSLQTLLKKFLTELGYNVLIAGNGIEALETIFDSKIDLIITDMVMPKMGGAELIEKLKITHPELRVIFTSGYSPDKEIENNGKFIEKPYSLSDLAIKIRSVLDS